MESARLERGNKLRLVRILIVGRHISLISVITGSPEPRSLAGGPV
jgi:hypothetical protein